MYLFCLAFPQVDHLLYGVMSHELWPGGMDMYYKRIPTRGSDHFDIF